MAGCSNNLVTCQLVSVFHSTTSATASFNSGSNPVLMARPFSHLMGRKYRSVVEVSATSRQAFDTRPLPIAQLCIFNFHFFAPGFFPETRHEPILGWLPLPLPRIGELFSQWSRRRTFSSSVGPWIHRASTTANCPSSIARRASSIVCRHTPPLTCHALAGMRLGGSSHPCLCTACFNQDCCMP